MSYIRKRICAISSMIKEEIHKLLHSTETSRKECPVSTSDMDKY